MVFDLRLGFDSVQTLTTQPSTLNLTVFFVGNCCMRNDESASLRSQ